MSGGAITPGPFNHLPTTCEGFFEIAQRLLPGFVDVEVVIGMSASCVYCHWYCHAYPIKPSCVTGGL